MHLCIVHCMCSLQQCSMQRSKVNHCKDARAALYHCTESQARPCAPILTRTFIQQMHRADAWGAWDCCSRQALAGSMTRSSASSSTARRR